MDAPEEIPLDHLQDIEQLKLTLGEFYVMIRRDIKSLEDEIIKARSTHSDLDARLTAGGI